MKTRHYIDNIHAPRVTALEYGLLAALINLVTLGAVVWIGGGRA